MDYSELIKALRHGTYLTDREGTTYGKANPTPKELQAASALEALTAETARWKALYKSMERTWGRAEAENAELREAQRWIAVNEQLPGESDSLYGRVEAITTGGALKTATWLFICNHAEKFDKWRRPLPDPPQKGNETL